MRYICNECNMIFEYEEISTYEEKHGFNDGRYEYIKGCPNCGSDFTEAILCPGCYGEFFEEQTHWGWCENCLKNSVTYDTFFEYCETYKEFHLLDAFVMSELLGGMDCPEKVTDKFHELMVKTYKNEVVMAQVHEDLGLEGFLDSCFEFIKEDDLNAYAEWLNKREVK